MSPQAQSVVLLVAGLVFALFVASRLLPLGERGGATGEARKRLREIKQRAADHATPAPERAAALREAASIALHDLGRPGLAASLARRAERVDPQSLENIPLLALALRRQHRYRALERTLWAKLAPRDASAPDPLEQRALAELIRLYEGPLDRPEIALALRRWPGAPAGGAPPG